MQKPQIKSVATARDMKEFLDFPETLYKDSPYYIPKLYMDQKNTLARTPDNPASAFCEWELFLAVRDGKTVGRVAAIINHKANSQWNHREVRFGWLDFVDDRQVCKALLDKVEEYGRERGMDKMTGPLGFTDFDPEGMLVEGFDRTGTMALIYNHPYYPQHLEALGFQKDVDWIEYKINIPETLPDKFIRVAEIVRKRENLHFKRLSKRIIRKEDYGRKIFKLINDCYQHLYDFTILPDDMAGKYLDFYLNFLDFDYVSMVENEKDELVAFGITMPSINRALQKSRGKFFPFGWIHLLKSLYLKKEDGIEMLLIGVRPDYQNRGINSLLFVDMFSRVRKMNHTWAETNAVLETNVKNQAHWTLFDHECAKRRRSYFKKID